MLVKIFHSHLVGSGSIVNFPAKKTYTILYLIPTLHIGLWIKVNRR